MTYIIGILLAVIVFFIVVFIHEMGHFLVARCSGVKVHEFGIGIPPRLFRLFRDKNGTEWTFNWIPLGGFVRLKGEDIFAPESREKDSLPQAPWWKQVAILLAGVTMNFILAGCLFGVLFYQGTHPLTIHIRELSPNTLLSRIGSGTQLIPIFDTLKQAEQAGVIEYFPGVLADPLPGSIGSQAGLKRGDSVLKVDGQLITKPLDFIHAISSGHESYTLGISRESQELDIIVFPKNGKIGVQIAPNIRPTYYRYGAISSLAQGMREVVSQISFSYRTFAGMIRTKFSDTASSDEKKEAMAGVGGPVAIARVFVGMADKGVALRALIILTAMISLSLGVINLLPFPALDGGRCLFVLVNQCIHIFNPKYKISPKVEQMINSAGFMVLMVLMILVTVRDVFFH